MAFAQAAPTIINEGPSAFWTAVTVFVPACVALLVVVIGGRQQADRFRKESAERSQAIGAQAAADRRLRLDDARRVLYSSALIAVDDFVVRSDHSSTMAVRGIDDPDGGAARWQAHVRVRELFAEVDILSSEAVRSVATDLLKAVESAPYPGDSEEIHEWIESPEVERVLKLRRQLAEGAREELLG